MDFSRQNQLDNALVALDIHSKFALALRKSSQDYSAQASQLEGVYDEVDKLTKSKSIVPPSDLLVEVVNNQIADAKGIVFRDVYLDRLKKFVPAGNNPSYPDLLLALRILQQSLERFHPILTNEREKHANIGADLATILAALKLARHFENEFYSEEESDEESTAPEGEGDDLEDAGAAAEEEQADQDEGDEDEGEANSEESDEYQEFVPESYVRQQIGGPVSESWFKGYGENRCFDFSKLDRLGIPSYQPSQDGITYVADQK
jgi:hypothetical protein